MNKRILAALLGVLAVSFITNVQADDAWVSGTHLTVDGGLAYGGDKLVTVNLSNGSSDTIYAGEGVVGAVGVQHNFDASNFSLKASLGFKYWGVHASNNDTTFTRYPLDLLGIYSLGDHHFGAGLTHELSPKLDLGSQFGGTVDFNDATGLVLQYQYSMFGVRYTNIKYTPNCSLCSGNVSGDSIGIFFDFVF